MESKKSNYLVTLVFTTLLLLPFYSMAAGRHLRLWDEDDAKSMARQVTPPEYTVQLQLKGDGEAALHERTLQQVKTDDYGVINPPPNFRKPSVPTIPHTSRRSRSTSIRRALLPLVAPPSFDLIYSTSKQNARKLDASS
ncbi:hypothetical protein ACP4OV_020533 [Aristida adscensionis]